MAISASSLLDEGARLWSVAMARHSEHAHLLSTPMWALLSFLVCYWIQLSHQNLAKESKGSWWELFSDSLFSFFLWNAGVKMEMMQLLCGSEAIDKDKGRSNGGWRER